jgi:phosphoglycerol transferase MdoB-like AlkP superfamily enzyme
MSNAGAYVKNTNEMAIVLNTPFTLIHSFEIRGYKRVNYFSSEEELNSVYSPVHKPSGTEARKENVVIFIVESMNKEFLGSLTGDLDGGKYKGYTPFLDSLVGISKTFLHSYANGRKSIDALSSVLTSIPRVEMPFVLTPYYNNNLNSLPGLLNEKGYKSAFFHGAPNGSMGFLAFTNLIGVEEYYGKTEYNNNKDFDGIWGIWDEDFMQFFAHTIDTFSKPFIATLFTVSSHHPFEIPRRYKGKFKKDNFVMSECVQYTDFAFRRFFETASKMPWFKNTLFIITADHVSLNQREEFKNDIGYFSVPVIFYKPGSNMVGLDKTTNAQQADIMPTVLNYLGYDKEYLAFGKDLFDPKSPNVAFNYLNDTYRLFMDDYLLIFDGKYSKGFFHVDTYRQLSADVSLANPKKKEEMERYLKAFIQQYKNRMIDNKLTVK